MKKHYLIGEELFYGTAKKAFARAREMGNNPSVIRIKNKARLRELLEAEV